MQTTWDDQKLKINKDKHGLSFVDIEPVFYDPYALTIEDRNIKGEQRFVTTGCDALGRIITVVYTYREAQIRIISARRATKKERNYYEKELRYE